MEAAEAALRAALRARNQDDADIDDAVAAVTHDPNRYRERPNEHGDLARCILAPQPLAPLRPIVAPVPAPIVPRREPSVHVEVEILSSHKYFLPLGPKVCADAPVDHSFSHCARPDSNCSASLRHVIWLCERPAHFLIVSCSAHRPHSLRLSG